MIRPAEGRTAELMEILERTLIESVLSPSLAGRLYGELVFLSSQYFGRLGRAQLSPL